VCVVIFIAAFFRRARLKRIVISIHIQYDSNASISIIIVHLELYSDNDTGANEVKKCESFARKTFAFIVAGVGSVFIGLWRLVS
jgi:hypothetical protein